MSRLDMGGNRIQETKIPVSEACRPGLYLDSTGCLWTLQRHPVSSPLFLSFPFRYTVWGDKAGNKTVFIPCIFLMIIFLSFYTSKIWTFMNGILGMMM